MDAYLGRVYGLLLAIEETVPAHLLFDAKSLIEHGESAEGLVQAAWGICNSDSRVPRWVVDGIHELTAELIPTEVLPEHLDRHVS